MTWAQRVITEWDAIPTDPPRAPLIASLSRIRWDLFWTQTFRLPKRNANACQIVWSRCLAELFYSWDEQPENETMAVTLFALEPHADYPSLHVHALLSMLRPMPFTIFKRDWRSWKNWCWETQGKALFLMCRSPTFIWYVTKYVMKGPRRAKWMTDYHWDQLRDNHWGILYQQDLTNPTEHRSIQ